MNKLRLAQRFLSSLCCLTLLSGCGTKKGKQAAEQSSTPAYDWPREITKNGNRLTFYQPQVDAWTEYRQLDGRVAVVLTPAGAQSVTGMITLQAQTDTDLDERTVVIHDIRVTSALSLRLATFIISAFKACGSCRAAPMGHGKQFPPCLQRSIKFLPAVRFTT
jgi:hypothetical protein